MAMQSRGFTTSGQYSYACRSHVTPRQPQTCKLPGCNRARYVEYGGRVHDFCGRTHAQEYSKAHGYGIGPTAQRRTNSTPSSTSSRQPMRAVHHATSFSTSNAIKFYNRGEPYYEFTNFYPCKVFIDGKTWPTTEHYFQGQKFIGTPYLEKIRNLPTPRDAFQLSRDPLVSRWRRSDWETIKDDIMLKALRVKFSDSCSVQLRDKLRSTGEKELVEHTSNDSYWGDGGNGTGKNKLGKLLMKVRSELLQTHGPYTVSVQQYRSTRDDSSISSYRSATTTPTKPRLRRSNSLSSIADHRSPPAYTGYQSNIPSSKQYGTIGSYYPAHHAHHPPVNSSAKSYSSAAKQTGGKVVKELKTAAKKATQAISPSPRYSIRGNQSSVGYDIVTNKNKKVTNV